MDAVHYKVMDEKNRPVTRAIYHVLGVDRNGYKDLLGMYISKSEGANFWLSPLTDLQSRGVKDILIACTDNLSGFSDAILSVFPETTVQSCIVHQIRNSVKYKSIAGLPLSSGRRLPHRQQYGGKQHPSTGTWPEELPVLRESRCGGRCGCHLSPVRLLQGFRCQLL